MAPDLRIKKMIKQPLIIGDRNTSVIASGANTLGVRVTHNQGSDFCVEAFRISFATGQEEILVRVVDTQHNRDIITANTEICTVGVLETNAPGYNNGFIKIAPIVIKTGQSIELYVNNTSAGSIAIGDIALTLYGFQG